MGVFIGREAVEEFIGCASMINFVKIHAVAEASRLGVNLNAKDGCASGSAL